MASREPAPTIYQRNALAPGLIGAAALFLSPALLGGPGEIYVLYVVSILAVIVAWFAIQARQWWWAPVFVAIAVVWNPIYPIVLPALAAIIGACVGAVAFLAAGALIKVARA